MRARSQVMAPNDHDFHVEQGFKDSPDEPGSHLCSVSATFACAQDIEDLFKSVRIVFMRIGILRRGVSSVECCQHSWTQLLAEVD